MIVENKQIYQVKSINLSTATDRSKAKLCSIAKIRNQLNYKIKREAIIRCNL